jgi:hypothetical protein
MYKVLQVEVHRLEKYSTGPDSKRNCYKADVYYLTPQGRRLGSCKEGAGFIQDYERFKGTLMKQNKA